MVLRKGVKKDAECVQFFFLFLSLKVHQIAICLPLIQDILIHIFVLFSLFTVKALFMFAFIMYSQYKKWI